MTGYIEGMDRRQAFLLPACVDDYVDENNPVRVVEAFVDRLDLAELGFERAVPAETGRPAYHPATLLKLYIYGYLSRIPSSRRLGRVAQRNLEPMWLLRHLAPDFKTIADFRRDNGPDARSMATSGKGTGIVGYNVQLAVEAEHHLIVAHAVTNVGNDRAQLVPISQQARAAIGCDQLTVLADQAERIWRTARR